MRGSRLATTLALALVLGACAQAPTTGGPSTWEEAHADPSQPQPPAERATPEPVAAAAMVVPAGYRFVPAPGVPEGPRRIGIQAGHWRTAEVPDELERLRLVTGGSAGGVNEVDINVDVAHRAAEILRGHGYAVDVLPTTIPPGYLADVFVSLHADAELTGTARGYKAAHGFRRGPHEGQLLGAIVEEFASVTGLPENFVITRNMTGYHAFNWRRYRHTVAPHTPAVILEMGYVTNAVDRAFLVGRRDLLAQAVAQGILRFLDEVTPEEIFAQDLLIPAFRRSTPVAVP